MDIHTYYDAEGNVVKRTIPIDQATPLFLIQNPDIDVELSPEQIAGIQKLQAEADRKAL